MERICGVETEFGCLVRDPSLGDPDEAVEMVKDQAFQNGRWGLIDRHARDAFFEPAEAGGFLINGGRLYVDVVGSHLEYASPECSTIDDLIAFNKAGQRLLVKLVEELDWHDRVSFHNNNVDHYGGHTFGFHENYSLDPQTHPYGRDLGPLIPFLVTRQIFAGAGRVSGHLLTDNPSDMIRDIRGHRADYAFLDQIYGVEALDDVDFQLSQRADHILYVASGRVRFSRALINPKWDSFQDASNWPRLHILFGESNMCDTAMFLKIGATALVLDAIEADIAPRDLNLSRPVRGRDSAIQRISHDPDWQWLVELEDGRTMSAIDIQREYLHCAEAFRGRDAETDRVLETWERVLDTLADDPLKLSTELDWVAKYQLLQMYRESEGLDWDDDALQSIDLEYHNVDPTNGLYHALEETGDVRCLVDDATIEAALYEGPSTTRAHARAQLVRALRSAAAQDYLIEWDGVTVGAKRALVFEDPFDDYADDVQRFLNRLP